MNPPPRPNTKSPIVSDRKSGLFCEMHETASKTSHNKAMKKTKDNVGTRESHSTRKRGKKSRRVNQPSATAAPPQAWHQKKKKNPKKKKKKGGKKKWGEKGKKEHPQQPSFFFCFFFSCFVFFFFCPPLGVVPL